MKLARLEKVEASVIQLCVPGPSSLRDLFPVAVHDKTSVSQSPAGYVGSGGNDNISVFQLRIGRVTLHRFQIGIRIKTLAGDGMLGKIEILYPQDAVFPFRFAPQAVYAYFRQPRLRV